MKVNNFSVKIKSVHENLENLNFGFPIESVKNYHKCNTCVFILLLRTVNIIEQNQSS